MAALVTKEASAIVCNHHLELIPNNAIWATNDVLHMTSILRFGGVAVARILQNGRMPSKMPISNPIAKYAFSQLLT